ncbi:hypothetical protein AMELA_G00233780 [Ameiurus melas]|uniref:Glycosyl hydrolases family 22 (GH22) domain-containing protein n=1 Tax=Ameiurus melas TaxID=219545 RepID=A0A7J5ZXW2_AMEME|nr:hypothetical protein AMELA_G00233780 [Ameiurus melas]
MKVRVGVEMLATLVVLFLALGVSDGVVMNKCELGDELNTTLPANLLDQITNLLAKIVCHVELSSHFNTSTINHVIGPNVHSFIRGGRGGRKGRSAESSSEESSEEVIKLPDRIACTSGSEPSLNLCSMACDSLIDDNIRDDITCVETILNNMLSAANSPGPTKALFSKLYADFFQKECKNVEDFEYFSTC